MALNILSLLSVHRQSSSVRWCGYRNLLVARQVLQNPLRQPLIWLRLVVKKTIALSQQILFIHPELQEQRLYWGVPVFQPPSSANHSGPSEGFKPPGKVAQDPNRGGQGTDGLNIFSKKGLGLRLGSGCPTPDSCLALCIGVHIAKKRHRTYRKQGHSGGKAGDEIEISGLRLSGVTI